MRHILTSTILSAALASGSLAATPLSPVQMAGDAVMTDLKSAQIVPVKNDKAQKNKGQGNGKAKGKPNGKAKVKTTDKSQGKAKQKAAPGQAKKSTGQSQKMAGTPKSSDVARTRDNPPQPSGVFLPEGLTGTAPEDRDMTQVLATTPLIWAEPGVIVADRPVGVSDLQYRNCPPGLLKKDTPCVPPGLAKKGVTTEEWLSYGPDRYEDILEERRPRILDRDGLAGDYPLLLNSDQVAALYGLDPAPAGQRYALIDGLPVLLDNEDYRALRVINALADTNLIDDRTLISPTAALTQPELRSLYRLPDPGPDRNYALVNGQLLALDDEQYELLQLMRISRAVF